jgi:hypothetical protein
MIVFSILLIVVVINVALLRYSSTEGKRENW